MNKYNLQINGRSLEITAHADMPLLWALRDMAGLKGTKFGCGMGQCGACTVHIDGKTVRSCQIQMDAIPANSRITTIEGVSDKISRAVQEAWVNEQVPQCGYCQSGQIMSAIALLRDHPAPTLTEIHQYMSGNICRCGTYQRILRAVQSAAASL